MIALRYGTPPIVRPTGGLADTSSTPTRIPGAGTGFVFDEATPDALAERCLRCGDPGRARMGPPGMTWSAARHGAGLRFWEYRAPRRATWRMYRRAIGLRRELAPAASHVVRRSMSSQFVVQLPKSPRRARRRWPRRSPRAAWTCARSAAGHRRRRPRDPDHGRRPADEGGPGRGRLHVHRGRIDPRRGRRPAGRHGAAVARARRRRRQHLRPPVPGPLGRPGDVHVRRGRPGERAPHPRAQGVDRTRRRENGRGAGRAPARSVVGGSSRSTSPR